MTGDGKKPQTLSDSLLLTETICRSLGFESNSKMLEYLRSVRDGYDEEGRSYLFHALISRETLDADVQKHLEEYDQNIRKHLESVNRKRPEPKYELKYYQYLAVLATEIYLDRYFRGKMEFFKFLNTHGRKRALEMGLQGVHFTIGSTQNLLAYWMATGSGKTVLMHLHYLQFLHYNQEPNKLLIDNILLITPNERLSQQHLEELRLSGIHAIPFQIQPGSQQTFQHEGLQVIEITKLKEEKTTEGKKTIDITQLGSHNLIFVDEGHKGSGGESWFKNRDSICKDGFAFEYSATFGQAIMAGSNPDPKLLDRYRKAILIDYSYPHFYGDGYGKEFNVLNVSDEKFTDDKRTRVMYANLLSFYQQWKIFQDHPDLVKKYHLEDPLWIYLGSKVIGRNTDSGVLNSDVYKVVAFLHQITTNPVLSIQRFDELLAGKSGLVDKTTKVDIFVKDYPDTSLGYIRNLGLSAEDLYAKILADLFGTVPDTPLHLVRLRGTDGEIFLKYANGSPFGLINIGDEKGFTDLVSKNQGSDPGSIQIENEVVARSVFSSIDQRSDIILLIGAKRFIEGWNSFRVSSMGLLNMGKSEGPEIIQLFGRGIRLHGKGNSLKRTEPGSNEDVPDYLKYLETLFIFGIEADYMKSFRDFIGNPDKGGVDKKTWKTLKLPVEPDTRLISAHPLYLPKVEPKKFRDHEHVHLSPDITPPIHVIVDLMPVVDMKKGLDEASIQTQNSVDQKQFPVQYIDGLNWDMISWALDDLRYMKGWHNFVYDIPTLQKIVSSGSYALYCPDSYLKPVKFIDLNVLEEVAIAILKKYLNAFYHRVQSEWAKRNLQVEEVTRDHPNINLTYTINVSEKDTEVKKVVEGLLQPNKKDIFGAFEGPVLKNVHWSRHLYQPLLSTEKDDREILTIQPTGINNEEKFVRDLIAYLEKERQKFSGFECYLLRNLPKRGVGFFETGYFYPDFIFWMVRGKEQQVLFLEPHGMASDFEKGEEKRHICSTIRVDYEGLVREKLKEKGVDLTIMLDAYIISVSDPGPVRHRYPGDPRDTHIVHQIEPGYIGQIFDRLPILTKP